MTTEDIQALKASRKKPRPRPSAAAKRLAASLLSEAEDALAAENWSEAYRWLSLAEERAVVLSALKGAPGKGVTEAECAQALTWAKEARLHSVLLDIVLDGRINLVLRGGKVHWAGA